MAGQEAGCSEVVKNLDITRDSELVCVAVQEAAFLALIGYVAVSAYRHRAWTRLEGSQRTVVAWLISISLGVCLLFFGDNLAQIGIYEGPFQEDPRLQPSAGLEAYVVCVWLVNLLLINFYILIAYLWQIIIRESSGQPPSRRFPVLLLTVNILQVLLMVVKYCLRVAGFPNASALFDESYTETLFSTLAIVVLLVMTYRFKEHLKYAQLAYSKGRLLCRIAMLLLSLLTRIAYNAYYAVSLLLDSPDSPIQVDENCRRNISYYGVFLVVTAFLLFMLPVYAVNSLFSRPLSKAEPAPDRAYRESIDDSLIGSVVRTSS